MTEPINIIFLDVDGVLNSLPYCQTAPIGSYVDISEDNLRDLAVLYRETQAQIVLSSTWRELKDAGDTQCRNMYQGLLKALSHYGMSVYSMTPRIHGNRPEEIRAWLEMQTDRQICFVSLDDDFSQEAYDETGIGHCLVRTRYFCHTMEEGGLQEEHVRQALQKLENQRCSFQKYVSHSTHTPVFWTDSPLQTNS